jgi:hypothetical protein
MGDLGRTGRHTTALAEQDVKRTFSGTRQILTGLSRHDTLEARGKDFCELRDSMV